MEAKTWLPSQQITVFASVDMMSEISKQGENSEVIIKGWVKKKK